MAIASMPLQYKRLYKGPLDQDEIFNTIDEAKQYAKSPTAYCGQIISAYDSTIENWKLFVIGANYDLIDYAKNNGGGNTSDSSCNCVWSDM